MAQIYATLGPACAGQKIQEKMFLAGMTGMRLNLSHTGLKESEWLLEHFWNAAKSMGVKPQLLIDMQGPELRIGKLEQVLELEVGQKVCFVNQKEEMQNKDLEMAWIPIPKAVLSEMKIGDEILLNDGKISIEIIEKETIKTETLCVMGVITRGGLLSGHKSIKIVGRQVKLPVLTEHDIANVRLAKEYGVTGLMQPFVQNGKDLEYVRQILKENNAEQVKIFAKIENKAAVAELEGIVRQADVVIIARGDLGNDMPLWELPAVQKHIEDTCKKLGKPFIVVTQMLASMEDNPVPTRAEVSDIFHAVFHGAYGVMITGESAVGKYPVEAVTYLANTAKEAEIWRKNVKKNTIFDGGVYCENS